MERKKKKKKDTVVGRMFLLVLKKRHGVTLSNDFFRDITSSSFEKVIVFLPKLIIEFYLLDS